VEKRRPAAAPSSRVCPLRSVSGENPFVSRFVSERRARPHHLPALFRVPHSHALITTILPPERMPGKHSELIGRIIDEFAPRFAPGAEVIYVGDTGSRTGYFQQDRLADLGMTVDQHGKMADVVIYFRERD